MAAPCVTALRTALKGVLLMQMSQTPTVCQCLRLHAARCRPLHVSPAAALCSSRVEPQRSSQTHSKDDRRAGQEEDESEGPEYIPKRKAKNPMMSIGYAWLPLMEIQNIRIKNEKYRNVSENRMIGLPTGIIGFLLAKREVDKNRLKQLKVRQRMKKSNEGKYEASRYRSPAED
ncbi:DUF4748 domain-containing protein isoform X1 [Micropterus salmoides]|uniref:DUF4748 domain-containing protein isoform X1 n=1 Tax=Micropterus salmoides TaxID=27706 RepID=UPI0018EB66B6|nr:DUF4748 domain-containing protein isoform X1 [Micropterus salmoides]